MKLFTIILSFIFIAASLHAQEVPVFYGTGNAGPFIADLNNEAAKFLIAHHPALVFWLAQARHAVDKIAKENQEKSTRVKQINFNIHLEDLIVNAKGDRILLTTFNSYILFDIQEMKIVKELSKAGFISHNIKFNHDGSLFAFVNNKDIEIYSAADGSLINKLESKNNSEILELVFAHDKNYLAIVVSGMVKIWDLEKNKLIQALPIDGRINAVDFNKNSSKITICCPGRVLIVDLETHKIVQQISIPGFDFRSAEFHSNKNQILLNTKFSIYNDVAILWNLENNGLLHIQNFKNAMYTAESSHIFGLYRQNGKSVPSLLKLQDEGTPRVYQLNDCPHCSSFRVAKNRMTAIVEAENKFCIYDILSGIKFLELAAVTKCNKDASLLVFHKANNLYFTSFYDLALKETLLGMISIDQAIILIELYNNLRNDKYAITQDKINKLKSLPYLIKAGLVNSQMVDNSILENTNTDSRKRKAEQLD